MNNMNDLIAPVIDSAYKNHIYGNQRYTEDRLADSMQYDIKGLSNLTDYVPYYSLWMNLGIHKRGTIEYSILDPLNTEYCQYNERQPIKNFIQFFYALSKSDYPKKFKTASMARPLYVMKGLVFEIVDNLPNVLFLLTVKSDYISTIDKNKLDYSKLRLYISRDILSPALKSVYKKLNDEVIAHLVKKDIDVLLTNDISSKIYVSNEQKLKFKSITEMNEYFKSLNQVILYGEENKL